VLHFAVTRKCPCALYPFDLAHLKALSLFDDLPIPWQKIPTEKVQALELNATVRTRPFTHTIARTLTMLHRTTPSRLISRRSHSFL
jgi:hypothetical protein